MDALTVFSIWDTGLRVVMVVKAVWGSGGEEGSAAHELEALYLLHYSQLLLALLDCMTPFLQLLY